MYLKELTLKGFKSFADKTTFLFDPPPSITVIVGPNGCGKSNIIDAVRFVIGEQSLKELRGATLEEIIFAGSANRKPLSMAEVSMTIDNSDGKLKTEYSEVSIKRRIFRSGESEFYINKNLCRLKDIKELFLDTGIGEGGYSIVSQGQVDLILSSKPEDRRFLFEEAAGINKYKFRKKAAEKKLISTEQNLLRVSDLRNEIKENLLQLEEQAKKAIKYNQLKDTLKKLEIGLGKRQIKSLTEKLNTLRAKVGQLKEKTAGVEKDVIHEEQIKQQLKDKIRETENEIENIRNEISKVKNDFEHNTLKLEISKERLLQLEERVIEAEREIEKLKITANLWEEKVNEKTRDLISFREQFSVLQEQHEQARKMVDEINKTIEESIHGWNLLKNPIFEREMEISSQQHKISQIEISLKFANEALQKDKSFLENLKGLKEDISILEKEVFSLEGISNELKERFSLRKVEIFQKIDIEIELLSKSIASHEENIKNLENEKASEENKLQSIQKDFSEMNAQFSALENQLKQLNSEKEQRLITLAELRASLSTNEQLLKQKLEEENNLKIQLQQTKLEIENKEKEIISLKERIEKTKEESFTAENSLPGLKEKETNLLKLLEEKLSLKQNLQNDLEQLEEKIKNISGEDKHFREELTKEEINLAKLEVELNNIETFFQQEYNLSPEQVIQSEIEEISNQSKAKEEIEQIKSTIREMGPVNLLAMEEFESTKERLSFIENQYNDLVTARDNLNSLIKQLDDESRQKFISTIQLVNKNFSEIFSILFEGGEAKIELLDGDPLESGIEIYARPEGKKWLSIELMSGGEKSLIAISILLALSRTNPSPFCFMDEVDAALDEVNIIRFTKLLKEFSLNSQIILVTHNKKTMSVANTMYGITMEEAGVSKLVSMKLVKVSD